jgi:ADP-heptose:LPS heptosyltransferase
MAAKTFPILFIAPADPLDAVAASGLVKRLAEEIPEARYTIVASPRSAPLFAEVPDLAELIVLRSYGKLSLWPKVQKRKWGLVADAAGCGIAGLLRRQRRAELKTVVLPENRVITYARMLDLADTPPAPFLFTAPERESLADGVLAGEGPILGVGPGAEWIGRLWPSERYGQVAAKLLLGDGPMAGGRIVAFGGEADREAMLTAKFPLPRNRIILRPYDQDWLTDYAWMKRLRLFIGGDNIWTQLAAAAGAPTLAVFGPTDEAVHAPYGPHARVVRGPRPFEAFRNMDRNFDQQISHMHDIPAETVLLAAKALLSETAA